MHGSGTDGLGRLRPRWPASTWVAAAVFTAAAILALRHGQDFEVFWRASRRFVTGRDLFPGTDGFLEWRYLPATALLFLPVAPLPFAAARLVWFVVLVVAGAASVAVLVRDTDRRSRPRLVALALAIASRPIVEELACGQVNLVLLLLLVLAFRASDEGRDIRAGLLIAVAIGMKVTPVLLLADAALRRRWRVVLGAVAGTAGLLAISVPFYGAAGALALHRAWIVAQLRVSDSLVPAPANQSIFAAVARMGAPTALALAASAVVVGIAFAAPRESRRSMLLLAAVLASPMGWIQNYVFALPAALRVAAGRHRWSAAVLGLALCLTVYDVTGPRIESWVFTRSIPLLLAGALFVAAFPRPPARAEEPTLGGG